MKLRLIGLAGLLIMVVGFSLPALAADTATPEQVNLNTLNESLGRSLSPGEVLVFSVKLLNFGLNSRADVVVVYEIQDAAGPTVYRETETVAVETTAAFVKHLTLPAALPNGVYILKTHLNYGGQTAPAESQFNFTVYRTILGMRPALFWALLTATIVLLLLLVAVLIWALREWRRDDAVGAITYDDIPEANRMYYEIIGESVAQMRLLAGDDAIRVARTIPGLEVDGKTGRVLAISNNPSIIINTLVLRYETLLGHSIQDVAGRSSADESNKPKKEKI